MPQHELEHAPDATMDEIIHTVELLTEAVIQWTDQQKLWIKHQNRQHHHLCALLDRLIPVEIRPVKEKKNEKIPTRVEF